MDMDLEKLNKNRIPINDVFSSKKKEVEVAGWVHNSRDLSMVKFIILRDASGIIQITGIKGLYRDCPGYGCQGKNSRQCFCDDGKTNKGVYCLCERHIGCE